MLDRVGVGKAEASDPELLRLVAEHAAYCRAVTPRGSGHAVVAAPEEIFPDTVGHVVYWLGERDGNVMGCIGLRMDDTGTAEIKTMHVRQAARGTGLADHLLEIACDTAQARGARRVVLETGRGDGFAASRRFYEKSKFKPIPAFGPYAADPFSDCMALDLE